MTESSVVTFDKDTILLVQSKKLRISCDFASKNLSESALKYAEKIDNYYYWNWGKTSTIVVYELPRLFSGTFFEVIRPLNEHCSDYMKENRLCYETCYNNFYKNFNKEILY